VARESCDAILQGLGCRSSETAIRSSSASTRAWCSKLRSISSAWRDTLIFFMKKTQNAMRSRNGSQLIKAFHHCIDHPRAGRRTGAVGGF
jgi:hypothetical protein